MQNKNDGFWHLFSNMRRLLNGINYQDKKIQIGLSESIFILGLFVGILPKCVLGLFYFEWYSMPFFERFSADVKYLSKNNPTFIKVYIGGISLQFILCLIAILLRVYFSSTSKKIHYVSNGKIINILNLAGVLFFSSVCTWIFLNISAFGFVGDHSWFEVNQTSSIIGMPLPANKIVLIYTVFAMPAILAPVLLSALIFIEYTKGTPITIEELQSGKQIYERQ